jgi:uncharacterized membrane protein
VGVSGPNVCCSKGRVYPFLAAEFGCRRVEVNAPELASSLGDRPTGTELNPFTRRGKRMDHAQEPTRILGPSGTRIARYLFAIALLPIGLAHLVYPTETAALVPAWLPARTGWAYLTGAGQIAAGLGVLFSILPRLAAGAEATMLTLFGLLVWVPAVVAKPTDRFSWTALLITWAIAAAAWVVAGSMARDGSPTMANASVRGGGT